MKNQKKDKEEVSFYLKNASRATAQITLQFFFGYKETNPKTQKLRNIPLHYATGLSVNSSFWENQRVKAGYPNYKQINVELSSIDEGIKKVFENLKFSKALITPELLKIGLNNYLGKNSIDNGPISNKDPQENPTEDKTTIAQTLFVDFVDAYIKEAKQHTDKFSESTITSYQNFINKVKEFEDTIHLKLSFENLTKEVLSEFFSFLGRYVIDKEGNTMAQNNIWKFKKNFRKFLNQADEDQIPIKFNFKDKVFSPKGEDVEHIYLNFDEIDLLLKLDLADRPRLDKIRDLWVMDSYLGGLRYSDLGRKLEPKELKLKNGITIEYVELRSQKTEKFVQIPIFEPVKKLYEKYDGEFPTPISNQKFNQYIKEIAKEAGLSEKHEISRTRNGKLVIENIEKWELVSAHTARRSFATNFYLSGVPAQTLMKITGHKTEAAFMKYIKAGLKEHVELFYNIAAPVLLKRLEDAQAKDKKAA